MHAKKELDPFFKPLSTDSNKVTSLTNLLTDNTSFNRNTGGWDYSTVTDITFVLEMSDSLIK